MTERKSKRAKKERLMKRRKRGEKHSDE